MARIGRPRRIVRVAPSPVTSPQREEPDAAPQPPPRPQREEPAPSPKR